MRKKRRRRRRRIQPVSQLFYSVLRHRRYCAISIPPIPSHHPSICFFHLSTATVRAWRRGELYVAAVAVAPLSDRAEQCPPPRFLRNSPLPLESPRAKYPRKIDDGCFAFASPPPSLPSCLNLKNLFSTCFISYPI